MNQFKLKLRIFKNQLATLLALLCVGVGLFWLIWILFTIISQGIMGIDLSVFTKNTPPPNEVGGLLNAISGSLIMIFCATFIATPLGVLVGVYLTEYSSANNKISKSLRVVNDVLLSAPSIVIGLFIYTLVVIPMGNYSALAGFLALALIQIPVIIRTSENMLSLVPNELREAAFALGMPKYKMILNITFKASLSGIITGILLSIARISGETAPLLFTSLSNQFANFDITKPMASLPVSIYQFALSPFENWQQLAWAGVLIITVFVLCLNLVARKLFKTNDL